jgi:uncharacterized protein (TIGR02594 family)
MTITGREDMTAPWMDRARKEIGIREVPGRKDNPRIEEYLGTTDYDLPEDYTDEVPWCSGFVNWVMEKSGYKGTDSAWSQSWRHWGKGMGSPAYGCIVVFNWGNGHGHVGFCFDADKDGIDVLGGNQDDEVDITRFRYSKVVAYRWPKDV